MSARRLDTCPDMSYDNYGCSRIIPLSCFRTGEPNYVERMVSGLTITPGFWATGVRPGAGVVGCLALRPPLRGICSHDGLVLWTARSAMY